MMGWRTAAVIFRLVGYKLTSHGANGTGGCLLQNPVSMTREVVLVKEAARRAFSQDVACISTVAK